MEKLDKNVQPDKRLAAVCGLYCPACSLFIGTHEDPERLASLAAHMGRSVDELKCDGCRSDRLCFYCKTECKMKPCAAEKGIDFCGECDEYPCNELKTFQVERPHRHELWDSQQCIKEEGYEEWFRAMTEHYACFECGVLNSAYDIHCRNCGVSPSSEYVKRHKNAVIQFFKRR